jgi:hypothetical protein
MKAQKKATKRSKKISPKKSKTTIITPAKKQDPIEQLIIGSRAGKPTVFDLNKLRVSHMLVTGASGAGKSYTFRVIAEQLYGIVPIFLFDPEEDYLSLKDKFDFVIIGGEGADAPIHPQTAEITIQRLMKANMSAIFNLYSMSLEDQYLWIETAIHTLMNLPREEWHPVAVMLDEAHLWCPESGEGNADARLELVNLAKRGRKRGIMNIWATQRIASVDKSAVSELQNYVIGKTVFHGDQERTSKVLGVVGRDKAPFFEELKGLNRGQFFIQGTAMSSERVLMQVNKAQTQHPEPGEIKKIQFPTVDEKAAVLEALSSIEISEAQPVNQVAFSTKGKVAGLYQAGSAMGCLYEHLAANNGQWLLQTELQKLVTAEVSGRLKALQAHGIQYGRWTIERMGTKWRINLPVAAPAPEPVAETPAEPVAAANESFMQ